MPYWIQALIARNRVQCCRIRTAQGLQHSRVTKVLAPWLNLIVQLASSQPPLMVPKAEMQSQETEPSNFYSSPLIEAEEDI